MTFWHLEPVFEEIQQYLRILTTLLDWIGLHKTT